MARCYEDFAVGEVVEAGPVVVTADAIKAFAAQFDPQPPNDTAPDAAVAGRVASGLHITCLNMRLLVDAPVRYQGDGKPRCGGSQLFQPGPCWRQSDHAARSHRPAPISRPC
jgi:acyl dehydratase